MPPSGYEPFLRAICENPEDDTARLVYADWLDESGDGDRAEFIRLQVAQADKPRLYDADYFRAEALFKKNAKTWRTELPNLTGIKWEYTFRRGFCCSVRAAASKCLLKHHTPLFASAPIQVLTLNDAGQGTLAKVLRIPELERLTELYLALCRVLLDRFRVLTDCPRLPRLRTLGIRGRSGHYRLALTDSEARAFAETPHFPALEEIYLDGTLSEYAAEVLRGRYQTVRFTGIHRQ
jgi:uncharacterized protein (TIGR02996 family)